MHPVDLCYIIIASALGLYVLILIVKHFRRKKQREAALAEAFEEMHRNVVRPLHPHDWKESRDSRAPWTPD
jgi:hypothetical protein